MGSSVEELAFEEGLRAIDQQAETLRSLRGSASTLLGANSILIAAMGRFGPLGSGLAYYSAVPLLVMVLSAVLCVSILWPTEGLVTRFSARSFFAGFSSGTTPKLTEVHRSLALHLDASVTENVNQLGNLMFRFRCAAISLLIAVAVWMVIVLITVPAR